MVTNAGPFKDVHGNCILGLQPDRVMSLRPERPSHIPNILELILTLTCVFYFLIARLALALSHWYHPATGQGAVDAGHVFADGVVHAHAADLPQPLALTSSHRLREGGKALHCSWAGFVVDPDRQKGDAGADVLESQVEAFPRQVLHHLGLRVDAQVIFTRDLVGCYGGHLFELALAESGAHVCIRLGCEEVEGFLAGQRRAIEGVAVAHNKLDFHKNPRG